MRFLGLMDRGERSSELLPFQGRPENGAAARSRRNESQYRLSFWE